MRLTHFRAASRHSSNLIKTHRHPYVSTARLTTSAIHFKKDQLPPRPTIPESETTKNYLKGSGPGGQKINKTSSAVQLTHVPTGIVVKSQATRSRTQNESIARRILAEKVELLEKGSESRVEKKRERESRKTRSGEKKRRRKYRALEDSKGTVVGEEEGFEEAEVAQQADEQEDHERNTSKPSVNVREV